MNMIKKNILIILSIFLISSLFAVQKNTQFKNNPKVIVTGYVESKGNMPFSYPAIQGDDGNEYYIICSEKQKRRLMNNQGKHLRFTLVQIDEVIWTVKKFKTIK